MTRLIVLFLISFNCFAIPEASYEKILTNKVIPFFNANFVSHYYEGVDKALIHYFSYKRQSNKALIIIPGRGEIGDKYQEWAFDLRKLGHDIHIWSPRGQARSHRDISNANKQHQNHKEDWTSDLKIFTDFLQKKNSYSKIDLMAHSMGAAIALRFMQLNPNLISRAYINTPMIEINTEPYPMWLSKSIAYLQVKRGNAKEYVFGGSDADSAMAGFEGNRLTRSQSRYEMYADIVGSNPEATVGSTTFGWLNESMDMGRLVKKNWKKLSNVQMVMAESGQDAFVRYKRSNRICAKLPKCKMLKFPHGKHELLMETDDIRNQILKEVMFLFQ